MIKVIFFLLNMLWWGQQTPSQTTYSNPMDGFILHSRSEQGITLNQMSAYSTAEEGDVKSDSDDTDDADDEFDPLVISKIWESHTDKNFKTSQKINKERAGELCSAFLPPILSPPR